MAEVHLLVSPRGGRGRAAAAAPIVRSVIERAGHTPVDISGDSAEASAEAVRAAVAAGAERVIAVGGDGTLHLALQGVVGTDAVLGVVPVGTGNDYARAFGLFGLSVEEAAARALGPSRPVDAISTDRQRWVAFSVTGGFSVDVNVRADRMRFPRGPSRYTAATLLTMPGLRHRELVVTVDGQRTELRSALFAVNNTPT
ncbi:MAG: diacylglycerol kinase family protein, partial [Acidimicrobiaceae bacterium]|nr:diacylglycerol kinase family protein [Acidimicrobiaceae bacterium]